MMVSTLLLDADGVVQSPAVGWREALGAMCGDAPATETFLEELFAAERPALTGEADFEVSLAELLARWNSPVSVADALRIWEMIEPAEAVLSLVDRLRQQGVRVCLATNQQPARAAFMADQLGYADRFDDLFISCRIGHAKPGMAYFRHVLEALGHPASEVLFIDDHQINVEAARQVGLNAEVYHLESGTAAMAGLLGRHGLTISAD